MGTLRPNPHQHSAVTTAAAAGAEQKNEIVNAQLLLMVVTSERPLAATLAYVIDDYGEAMMLYGEHLY